MENAKRYNIVCYSYLEAYILVKVNIFLHMKFTSTAVTGLQCALMHLICELQVWFWRWKSGIVKITIESIFYHL